MREAEIDRGDAGGIRRQIGENVAAARGDGHDMAVRPQRQRLEVELGVLPDLGIDEAAKQPLEQLFQETFTGESAIAPDSLFQTDMALGPQIHHPDTLRINSIRHIYSTIDASLMTAILMTGGSLRRTVDRPQPALRRRHQLAIDVEVVI